MELEFSGKGICGYCFQEGLSTNSQCSFCGADNPPNQRGYPLSLMQATLLKERYLLGSVLEQNFCDITYLAYDTAERKRCVIREYFPEKVAVRAKGKPEVTPYFGEKETIYNKGIQSFLSEAEALYRVSQVPSLVHITDCFEENRTAYIVTEYISGISFFRLNAVFRGRMPLHEVMKKYFPLLDALHTAHEYSLLHLDIYPGHLLISNHDIVTMIGFSAARNEIYRLCGEGKIIAHDGFAAREMYLKHGKFSRETDIYSMAACIYCSLTGVTPPEVIARIEQDTLKPLSAYGVMVPREFQEVLRVGMALKHYDRFHTAAEFKKAMEYAFLNLYKTDNYQ